MIDDDESPAIIPGPSVPEGAVSKELLIINKRGLHARASAKFVQTVERFTAEVWVTVPGLDILALAGFSPNPAAGEPMVSFSLANGERARLEVFDLSGRTVVAREVGALGGGSHRIGLGGEARLAPGVYWLRLSQAGRALTARGLVVR